MRTFLVLVMLAGCAVDEVRTSEAVEEASAEPPDGAAFPDWTGKRWTGGELNYFIDTTGLWVKPLTGCFTTPRSSLCGYAGTELPGIPSGPLTTGQINGIHRAVKEWENLTPVHFHEYTLTNPPPSNVSYVLFRNSTTPVSSANIRGMPLDGKTPDVVFVGQGEIGDQEGRRVIMHEVGHVLGMPHEQSRPDRDSYIVYNPTCCTAGGDKIMGIEEGALLLSPYDYQSIMQYKSTNSCDTIDACRDENNLCLKPPLLKNVPCTPDCNCTAPGTAPRPGDCNWIGLPSELSVHDVNTMWKMYEEKLGGNEPGDNFGTAVATGDFDGDGYLDLAIGAPHDLDHGFDTGGVYLFKGTAGNAQGELGRLVAWKAIHPAPNSASARAGATLAAGDFNHDGRTDLAIGAPGAGEVVIYVQGTVDPYSPRRGLVYDHTVMPLTLGMVSQAGDHFGEALAVGDFDGDGADDLAVGAPQRVIGGVRSGEVVVAYGKLHAGDADRKFEITRSQLPPYSNIEGERFGHALAAANLNPDADARDDLAIGAPQTATATVLPGAVYLFQGTASATFVGRQILSPSDGGQRMQFGDTIAVGDFDNTTTLNGWRRRELAIGAPHRRVVRSINGVSLPIDDAGSIYIYQPDPIPALSYDPTPADVVEEQLPATGNHLGSVLVLEPIAGHSDGLIAGLPDAGVGAIEVFFWSTLATSGRSGTTVPPASTAVKRFGAAIAIGNLLPAPGGAPGTEELIVGEPGKFDGAGAVHVRNVDQTDGTPYKLYSQETANPD